MPSASSSRYQSRLFNFFHRQSRQLKQQSDHALRNLRVAATWVATVGLYPLYLLFQSTSSVTRQVNQAVQQSLPQLPANNLDYLNPPSADTPIQQVLLAVDIPSEEAIVTTSQDNKLALFWAFLAFNAQKGIASLWRFNLFSNNPQITSNLTQVQQRSLTYNRLNIQGIATQLSSRTLVLITTQNQILDVFTHKQQKKLQKQIIDEVAGYWRLMQRREARGVDASATLRESEATQRARLEADGRWQMTGLMLHGYKILAILDRTVARLEAKHLAPVVEVAITNLSKRNWNLVQQIQKLTVSLSGHQLVNTKLPAIATSNDGIRLNDFESYKFRLQTLIFAAINYFFGSHNGKAIALPNNSTQAKLRYQRNFKLPIAAPVEQDPWLTLDDLFGEPGLGGGSTVAQHNASTATVKQLAGNAKVIPSKSARYSLRNVRDYFLKLSQSNQVSRRVLDQKTTKGRRGKVDQQLSLPTLTEYPSASQIAHQRSTQNTQVEAKPDWIETNATTIGYIKHPIEKILEWLDRLILWLEEILVKVLGRVQRVWQGK